MKADWNFWFWVVPMGVGMIAAVCVQLIKKKYYVVEEKYGHEKHIYQGTGKAIPVMYKILDWTITGCAIIAIIFVLYFVFPFKFAR